MVDLSGLTASSAFEFRVRAARNLLIGSKRVFARPVCCGLPLASGGVTKFVTEVRVQLHCERLEVLVQNK